MWERENKNNICRVDEGWKHTKTTYAVRCKKILIKLLEKDFIKNLKDFICREIKKILS